MTDTAHSDETELRRLREQLEQERAARLEIETISEKLTGDLYEKQKELILLQAISVAVNETLTIEDAMQMALDQICAHTRWPVGHVYLLDKGSSGELVPTAIWHLETPEKFEMLRQITGVIRCSPGVELPGLVLANGNPVWIFDVTKDPNFLRAKLVKEIGVKSAFAFPVLVGSKVEAVLEFFSDEAAAPNESLFELLVYIGIQLGRAVERMQSEHALEQSELNFRLLFADNPHAMWFYDLETLKFLEVNDSAVNHYGFSRDEFLEMKITHLRPPEEASRLFDYGKKGQSIVSQFGQVKHRLKDGRIIEVEINSHKLDWEGRKIAFVVAQDITDRKRTEEALFESERRFRDLLQNVSLISVMLDTEGNVTFCNHFLLELTGYLRKEIHGKNWFDTLIPPDQRDSARKNFFENINSGVIAPHDEYDILTCDGERHFISWTSTILRDSTGLFVGTAGIGIDLTQRRKAEQALRESEERYALAVRGANDGLWDWDLKTNKVYFSSRWKYLVGCKQNEIGSNPNEWFSRVPPESIDEVKAAIDSHLNGQDPHFESEHRMKHKDGSYRWVLNRGFAVRDAEGNPYRMAGSLTDITKRKLIEEEIRTFASTLEAKVKERTEELAEKIRQLDLVRKETERKNEELGKKNEELIASQKQADRIFSALAEALPGTVLDQKYRLDEKIGEGGFGAVFKGTHLVLNRSIAIKVFRPTPGNDSPEAIERFRMEGVSACRVQHPNAISVLDSGVSSEGIAYLVMELLEGHSLSQEIQDKGRLSLKRCVEIITPVSEALAEAHAAGIIHRDIKPDNIFLHHTWEGEIVKVLDFGVAKLVAGDVMTNLQNLTATGMIVGTPVYMAPERLRGENCDDRADVYSLGVMLYEMMCGRVPFQTTDGNMFEVGVMHLTKKPPPLRNYNPNIPDEVEVVVLEALSKSAFMRPAAKEFGEIFATVVANHPEYDMEVPLLGDDHRGRSLPTLMSEPLDIKTQARARKVSDQRTVVTDHSSLETPKDQPPFHPTNTIAEQPLVTPQEWVVKTEDTGEV